MIGSMWCKSSLKHAYRGLSVVLIAPLWLSLAPTSPDQIYITSTIGALSPPVVWLGGGECCKGLGLHPADAVPISMGRFMGD